jgi:Ser/Thr protein kinase RdoA (MazF antagonist)
MGINGPKNRYTAVQAPRDLSPKAVSKAAVVLGFSQADLEVELLHGGYRNCNYKLSSEGKVAVMRVLDSSLDPERVKTEMALTAAAARFGVVTSQPISEVVVQSQHCSLWEFIEGITLEDHLLSGQPISPSLFEKLGEQLAKIHKTQFSSEGYLNRELQIAEDIGNSDQYALSYLHKVLHQVSEERLSSGMKTHLKALLKDQWGLVEENSLRKRLTHFDFNPKNIMVTAEGQVAAILDWEFAMAANAVADFGNFFRFQSDYPNFASKAFETGYRQAGSELPDQWQRACKILDLVAVCGFFDRKQDSPQTFQTARVIIENTLAEFGY